MNEWLPLFVSSVICNSAQSDVQQTSQPVNSCVGSGYARKTKQEMEVENSRIALRELFGEKTETYTFGWVDPRSIK